MTKILGQIQGFRKLGCEMDLICFNSNSQTALIHSNGFDNGSVALQPLSPSSENLVIRRVSLLKAAIEHIENRNPTFLYLRYPRSEPLYISFLAQVRRRFPDLIIVSEFPTYPYEKEYNQMLSIKDKFVFFLDKLTRNNLNRYVDQIVSINYEGPILGIDTISIDNGIDASRVCPITSYSKYFEVVQLIGVANVNSWHGYDRVLRGLSEYYQSDSFIKQKVIFHIVGAQMPYLAILQSIVLKEGLSDYVVLHPPKQGERLDVLFADCHLAVGALGGHRKALDIMSPLKNREYCARGVPFIFSHIDPDFPADCRHWLQIAADDSSVNIDELLQFIFRLQSEDNIAVKMRRYAYDHLDWSVKLQPVVDYINNQANKSL